MLSKATTISYPTSALFKGESVVIADPLRNNAAVYLTKTCTQQSTSLKVENAPKVDTLHPDDCHLVLLANNLSIIRSLAKTSTTEHTHTERPLEEMAVASIESKRTHPTTTSTGWKINMFNSKRTDCFLAKEGIEWLGRGQQGYVWRGTMECNDGGDNSKEHVSIKSVNGKHARSSGPKQWRQLYDAIMMNSTEAIAKQQFSIPIGMLQLPPDALLPGMKEPSGKDAAFSISYLAPGTNILDAFPDGKIDAVEKRRQIARQIVRIFSHLLDRGILYCDMKTGMQHLFHSVESGATVLIDFDSIQMLGGEEHGGNDKYYHAHALEYLSLLAMVCSGQISRSHPDFKVDTSQNCGRKPPEVRSLSKEQQEKLVSALDKCEFDQPASWVRDWEHSDNPREKFRSLMEVFEAKD